MHKLDLRPERRAVAGMKNRVALLIVVACIITFVSMGIRQSFGLFLVPMTSDLPAVGRDDFALSVAVQNLVTGIAMPVAGYFADRFGGFPVLFGGALFFSAGLLLTVFADNTPLVILSFGFCVGIGLSCMAMPIVLTCLAKSLPPERHDSSNGTVASWGAVGLFVSVPIVLWLIAVLEWKTTLALFGLVVFGVGLCALVMPVARTTTSFRAETLTSVLRAAFASRAFWLVTASFFICGFQITFLGTHLPAAVMDRGMDMQVGGAALSAIGLANIVGVYLFSKAAVPLGNKTVLTILHAVRLIACIVFVMFSDQVWGVMLFSTLFGLTWLSTVPITTSVFRQLVGVEYLSTIMGIVFFFHQVGCFLGAWFGGLVFDVNGSYAPIWWLLMVLGVSAVLVVILADDEAGSAMPEVRVS